MKLRNLMYATMIACAFASCSKDDEVINGGETAKGDVVLDVQIANTLTTKSYGSDEATINTLGVYVFGSDSKLEGYEITAKGQTAEDNSRKVSQLTAGIKSVLVLANYQPTVTIGTTTAAELYNLSKTYDETATNLSMNSKIYENVVLQAGKVNYLGYGSDVTETDAAHIALDLASAPVYLYRNVGKVVLSQIRVNADNAKYPSATLDVEQVFILHAVASSKAAGNGIAWGSTMPSNATFLNGISGADYNAWKTTLVDLSKSSTITLKQDTLASGYADAAYNAFSNTYNMNIVSGNTSSDNAFTPFYPYENTNAKTEATLLVVKGKFNYTGVTGKSRYYSVAIGYDNVTDWNSVLPTAAVARNPYNGLYRNVQYNVALTVQGPGYETPFGPEQKDNTSLDVKVEVVPFGTVNQTPVIE